MDQHPIPQDVTGFQFKLIGSMTVKQFAYVAAGVISAVVLYYLPLKVSFAFLLKFFLIPLFGGSGFVIAFVPIDGRPIDVMTTNLVKALFSPNQYIYRKAGRQFSFSTITPVSAQPVTQQNAHTATPAHERALSKKELQLQAILHGTGGKVKNKLDEKEMAYVQSFASPLPIATPQPIRHNLPPLHPPQLTPTPITPQPKPLVQPIAQRPPLPSAPLQAPRPMQAIQQTAPLPVAPAAALHPTPSILSPAPMQQQAQPAQLKQTFLRTGTSTPQPVKPPPPPQVPLEHAKNISLPHVADVPNVVTGIVRDPRGNVLPNILVEVKDRDGNPIRAFKTNGLGHFASATPLPYGTYTIELEDPKKQHTFGLIQLNANNHIMQPIEIVSHDAREQLRQELFN